MGDFVAAKQDSLFFEVFKYEGATFFGGEAGVALAAGGQHMAVVADNPEIFEIVALPYFEVVEIVSRGDFDGAGAVFWVGVFVGNDGDGARG